ncbi:hypothetical protein ACFQV2_30355 [Actinokineospora soli]|uniref:Uncharacterized protein n=1 Tax=Actinokineospora soli TaxID=1048753 RepID=A0ABW2TWB9_9PSEU
MSIGSPAAVPASTAPAAFGWPVIDWPQPATTAAPSASATATL